MIRGRVVAFGVVAAAGVALAVPWPAATVEAVFSAGVYPRWQRIATTVTNALPFAAFDVVLVAAVLTLVVMTIRAWRREDGGRWRRAAGALVTASTVVAATCLWFLFSWGFNYQRVPVAVRVGLDKARATPERLAAFADETVDELNRLHPIAHARPWADAGALVDALGPGFRRALPRLGLADAVLPGKPKWSLLQPYFRWAGIDGVTDPFLPEIIVNHDLLPVEWPFTVAHEWGHLAGLAHEAEASYAAWLSCLSSDPQARYSARLWAFGHVYSVSSRERRLRLSGRLHDGPMRDLRAISRRTAQSVQVVRTVSWATYDQYLKSNRVSEGLTSYDAAITLVLASVPELRHGDR